ncbi:MAG: F0F1 ATP synthase subunit delta [Bifidobacteriaceae bacterium]|jgi:F-type H+-transporting ATPase subunit delta|nr:F0F1 ATP synthase subunit delta [Bifidobacteriaceae bacterium]
MASEAAAWLGASGQSLAQAKVELRRALAPAAAPVEDAGRSPTSKRRGSAPPAAAAPAFALALADELFALVDALDSDKALPRALTNPNREPAPKQALVRRAMAGHLPAATDLAASVCALRWSKEGDLADALEQLAFDAALAHSRETGRLEQVESELFEVDLTLGRSRELRTALGDKAASADRRAKLARDVFASGLSAETMHLVERLVRQPRGRGLRPAIQALGDLVASLRDRLVAAVTVAQPLTQPQADQLAAALRAAYGRAVQLNITVDPGVVGGLRCRVGDDVVDGSLLTRFADLRRQLAA